jgi:predicted CoA-binding protein
LQFLGDRCYPSLEASPVKLDVVNVVGSTEGVEAVDATRIRV